jgi:hypothetical protein
VVDLIRSELVLAGVDHDLDRVWLLSIPPLTSEGFSIDLLQSSKHEPIRCFFGLLEHECQSLDECFFWVTRALSNSYQLRIVSVSGQPTQWFLEPKEKESDAPGIQMGYVTLPLWWRRKSTEIRSNSLPLASSVPIERSG